MFITLLDDLSDWRDYLLQQSNEAAFQEDMDFANQCAYVASLLNEVAKKIGYIK